MAITVKESLLHWNYFLALENDLENLSRYIEFGKKNFRTYSIELAHLLLASASEVDVVAKEICELLVPGSNPRNINEYRVIIASNLPDFCRERIFVPRYGISFMPWERWRRNVNPIWWQSYNDVKHHRDDHFEEANLKNVLNSLGGLLITVFYYYKIKFSTVDPHTFRYKNEVILKLQPLSNFVRLSDNYYPSYVLNENNF